MKICCYTKSILQTNPVHFYVMPRDPLPQDTSCRPVKLDKTAVFDDTGMRMGWPVATRSGLSQM